MSLLDEFTSRLDIKTLIPFETYEGAAYHYTSLGNVNSMLSDDEGLILWASRHDCLNDASEGTLPEIRFAQACDRLRKSKAIDEGFFDLIRDVRPNRTRLIFQTVDGRIRPKRDEFKTYTASFSEDPDALAMWNYYSKGDRYDGMNIGVSCRAMLDSLNSSQSGSRAMEAEPKTPVKYRSNAGYVIPYIELGFGKTSVSQITLGPSFSDDRQKEIQQAVVREMLESRGYRALVKHSQIPVRY